MTNPTSNYSFQMPTATDLVTDLPADFEVFGQAVDTRLKALQPGTTLGDLAYSSATANTNTRLGVGSTGQVLTVAGGVPSWATPASGSTFAGVKVFGSTVGTLTLSDATTTSIPWDGEKYDTDGFHDNATNNNRLTVPTGYAGTYLVTGKIYWNNAAAGTRQVTLSKNTTAIALYYAFPSTTQPFTVQFSTTINLTVGDYVKLTANQNSGGNLDIEISDNYGEFTLTYLGA
jgi:hypothetical protein